MYVELVLGVGLAILFMLIVLKILGIPSFTIVYQGSRLVVALLLVVIHGVEYVCWRMVCFTVDAVVEHWMYVVGVVVLWCILFKMLTMVDEEDMCHMEFKEYIWMLVYP